MYPSKKDIYGHKIQQAILPHLQITCTVYTYRCIQTYIYICIYIYIYIYIYICSIWTGENFFKKYLQKERKRNIRPV